MPSIPTYTSTLRYLYGLQTRGMKFGLRNTRRLMAASGHPERLFPSIHVAGTNGKGSTASFLASIFMEAGYTVGLYTSPHLIRFTERIRINGKEIAERRLVEYAAMLRPEVERHHATFFEATTCIAFRYFADERVDIAIVEVGLGGRLDATNVLTPLASVITEIGFDHMEYLGTTLRSIAREKAGIIKRGIPVLTSASDPAVVEQFKSRAALLSTRCVSVDGYLPAGKKKGVFTFHTSRFGTLLTTIPVPGEYQERNVALAIATLDRLWGKRKFRGDFPGVSKKSITSGIKNVVENTGLAGRGESNQGDPRFVLNVAHNPDGMRTLVQQAKHYRAVIFGVMRDKDYRSMLSVLSEVSDILIAVRPAVRRALPIGVLMKEGRRAGFRVIRGGTVAGGMVRGARLSREKSDILVMGSFYVVGESLQWLNNRT